MIDNLCLLNGVPFRRVPFLLILRKDNAPDLATPTLKSVQYIPKEQPETFVSGCSFGGDKRDRTADLLTASQALSHQVGETPRNDIFEVWLLSTPA